MNENKSKRVIGLLSVLLAAGCSSSSDGTPAPQAPQAQQFDGTWVDCSNDGGSDMRDVIGISGGTVYIASYVYPTTDRSCGGAATASGTNVSATFTLGTPAAAWLGNLVVQATPVDVAFTPAFYSILWRDADVDPNILYTGDDGGKVYGGSAATRPTSLQTWRLRYSQTAPAAADLTGTWAGCWVDGLNDAHESITISGTTLSSSTTTYSSANGTCTGSVLQTSSRTAAFSVGDPTYSTLANMTVTGLAIDIPDATKPLYTVMWVDKRVTPSSLHVGDEAATSGYNGSTSALRATVLKPGKRYARQ